MEASRVRAVKTAAHAATWAHLPLAAAIGASSAMIAYHAGPVALPVLVIACGAVVLGFRRLEYGLAIVLLALPFAENDDIVRAEEAPLRTALIFGLAALVLVQSGRALASRERLRRPPLLGAVGAFLAIALIGVATTPESHGLVKFFILSGAAVFYLLIALFLDDPDKLKPVLAALVLSALLIGVHSIWQYQTGQFSNAGFVTSSGDVEYRIQSSFPNANQLAGFLAVIVPVALGLYSFWESRLARIGMLALAPIAIAATMLTYSRGALVGLVAAGIVFLPSRRAWPVLAAIVVGLALLAPGVWKERVAGASDTSRPEIATRLDFWRAAIETWEEHPVVGAGLDSFADSYVALESPGRTFLGGAASFTPPETAHNLYLNALAELGLVGFVALVFLIYSVFRMALAARGSPDRRVHAIGQALLGAAIVLFVHNFFDVTLLDPKNATQAFALFGIGAAALQYERRIRPR